jgi:hypothetical protein
MPLLVETYGRLGKLAVAFLGRLGTEVVAGRDVSKSGFVACSVTGAQHRFV